MKDPHPLPADLDYIVDAPSPVDRLESRVQPARLHYRGDGTWSRGVDGWGAGTTTAGMSFYPDRWVERRDAGTSSIDVPEIKVRRDLGAGFLSTVARVDVAVTVASGMQHLGQFSEPEPSVVGALTGQKQIRIGNPILTSHLRQV